MVSLKRIAAIVSVGSLMFACAKKPPVQISSGEDHNLFLKEELLGKALAEAKASDLAKGTARQAKDLPQSLAPLVREAEVAKLKVVSFDVGKDYLTLLGGDDASSERPVLQFKIVDHFDLRAKTNPDGTTTQYLGRDKTANLRWQERAYVEVDPGQPLRVKADDETRKNLYAVASLRNHEFAFAGEEDFAWMDSDDRREVISHFGLKVGDRLKSELTRRYLSLFRIEADGSLCILAQAKVEYVDLVPKKSDLGEPTPTLIKDSTLNVWNDRSYVGIDPGGVQLAKPEYDLLKHLFAKADLGRTFVYGKERIPLLSESKEVAKAISRSDAGAVKDGEMIKLVVGENSVNVYATDRLVLKYPIYAHVDVLPARDADGVLLAKLERNTLEHPWNERKYVLVEPDNFVAVFLDTNLADGQHQILARKDIDKKCFAADATPSGALKQALPGLLANLGKEAKVCFEISQTVLSIFGLDASGSRKLLRTYDILGNFDLGHSVSSDGKDLVSNLTQITSNPHWEEREYLEFNSKAPHVFEDHSKANAVNKSAFDGEFLYIATVTAAHSENSFVFPGSTLQATDRLKFQFDSEKLTAYKAHETLNKTAAPSPVLRYSVEHFDLQRGRNGYGDETNVLEEATYRPWNERQQVRVDFASNEIPSYFNDVLGIEKLYKGVVLTSRSRLASDVSIEDGLISFESEEVVTPNALSGFTGSNENFLEPIAIRIKHSFVKVMFVKILDGANHYFIAAREASVKCCSASFGVA